MARVGLFVPCFIDQLYPAVARATLAVLERCGVRAEFDVRQTCCGQPAFNSGCTAEAATLARRFIATFAKYDAVVAPSGSCVSMVRHHYAGLAPDPSGVTRRVFELCEFLVTQLGRADVGASFAARAALHMPCHLMRELGGAGHVRAVVAAVRGLTCVPLPTEAECCGFGGLFSVNYPELSCAMGEPKVRELQAAGVDSLISPESSCLMQLGGLLARRDARLRVLHVAQVLAGDTGPEAAA
ncbi:MAG: (Fe-S)-binding protein [Phycisphaerae bacterium]